MNKKLYIFKINFQHRKSSQNDARNEVLLLLNIAPIMYKLEGNEKKGYRKLIPSQEFVFETQEEARKFALRILETRSIFFSELGEREIEKPLKESKDTKRGK